MIDYNVLALPKGSSKLERAIAKKAARQLDQQQLRAWAHAVKVRDAWTDRYTGQRCTSERGGLDPRRCEAHHLEPRGTRATRYDVRNGVTLSLATHLAVEMGRLRIEGTKFFTIKGCRYIDGTYPVTFVRT